MKADRLGVAVLLATASLLRFGEPAGALYVDNLQTITVRARVYSQASIRAEDSQAGTNPDTQTGQLVQHRTFYNPELDAVLERYLAPLRGSFADVVLPDQLRFRIAGWGFYDGIYDYGASAFNDNRTRPNYPPVLPPPGGPGRALFLEGPELNIDPNDPKTLLGTSLDEVFPDHLKLDARTLYASRGRLNELYLSYSKGPLFLRIGRQSISWGESDTIALLDQNNPFDTTQGVPGVFQDLEESRIPLWTVRVIHDLFDAVGPLSDAFVEAYWVPGQIDTNTGYAPILAVSPYSPPGNDPQLNLPCSIGLCNQLQFVFFDHVPETKLSNSRYGFRAQTVAARRFTLSAWFYTHFPSAPVPRRAGATQDAVGAYPLVVTELVHELTSVYGVGNTFFFDPLDGIVRMELEYFENEPGFIPEVNLGPLDDFFTAGSVPKADFLRWELGFDRFFFVRWLNPSNSFTVSSAVVGSWNLSETSVKDFRYQGQLKQSFWEKPQGSAPTEDDFVQLKAVEAFLQTTLQSDYLHGRLTPRLTTIFHSRGTYLIQPSVQYRWRDWLLLGATGTHIGGEYQGFGFFRDRDQLSFRVTYQLN